jgi:hypothetical protein
MTIDDLDCLVKETMWFSRLGEPDVENACIRISTLAPWANQPTGDEALERVADQMDWLPSSRDQDDPIHGHSLEQRAEALGKKREFAQQSLGVYKTTLAALRNFEGHPALKVGPHDFTEATRGAALFASRRAAYEILLGEPGFWCRVMKIYHSGHWPCGVLPNKQIVVL